MLKSTEKYSYITHPDNFPLELKGNSKIKVHQIKKQDYKQSQYTMNQEGRSLLQRKLSKSKYDFQNNKSVLPQSESRTKIRPQSIKTYQNNKENINTSGVDYLIQKTEKIKHTNHKERAHLKQTYTERNKESQKRHFDQTVTEPSKEQELQPAQKHKNTQNTRITKDIYSNALRYEKEKANGKKVQNNNFFKRGEDLGYEQKKTKKFSDMKMIEMVGSQHVRQQKANPRERRQDWRVSNITFF